MSRLTPTKKTTPFRVARLLTTEVVFLLMFADELSAYIFVSCIDSWGV